MGDIGPESAEQEALFDTAKPPQAAQDAIYERLTFDGVRLSHEADLLARLICGNGGSMNISDLAVLRFGDDEIQDQRGITIYQKLRTEIEVTNAGAARKLFIDEETEDGMDLIISAVPDLQATYKERAVIVPYGLVRDNMRNQVVIYQDARMPADYVDDDDVAELHVEFIPNTGHLEDILIVRTPEIEEPTNHSGEDVA